MKLLIITIDDYPHCGGKSTHISSLISGLEKLDVKCDVFSGDYINQRKNKLLKLLVYPVKLFSMKRYLYLRKKIQIYLFKKELVKYIANKTYDMVSFQDAITCGYCGNLFDNSYLTMHTYYGIEYTLDGSGFSLDDKLYKKLLNIETKSLCYAKAIISVDDRIKKHVLDVAKSNNIKLPVFEISNFTNTDIFSTSKKGNKKFIIACVRRLVEKNGVIFAVKAMKHLKSVDCILEIYGDGPCMEEIKKYIDENQLGDKVVLHGSIDNSKLPDIYSHCNVVLVPSITVNGLQEATSISAIESMSCGIPTIASNIGGLPMLIEDNKTGMLVDEKDDKQIAKRILELIEDEEKYKNISKNCRNFILKNHSHLIAAQKYLDIFRGMKI